MTEHNAPKSTVLLKIRADRSKNKTAFCSKNHLKIANIGLKIRGVAQILLKIDRRLV